jgi:hypothetical protein
MSVVARPEKHFIAAHTLDWNSGPIGGLPRMASLQAGGYADPVSGMGATVVQVDPTQNIQEDRCHPASFHCNVVQGMVLLLADNGSWAPVQIEFTGNGVSSVGSYAVARWNPDEPPEVYTASMYVRLLGSGPNEWKRACAEQGFTGDIWSSANPSFAPFVGCEATGGDRIVAARFDVGHARSSSFSPVGITNLYFYV